MRKFKHLRHQLKTRLPQALDRPPLGPYPRPPVPQKQIRGLRIPIQVQQLLDLLRMQFAEGHSAALSGPRMLFERFVQWLCAGGICPPHGGASCHYPLRLHCPLSMMTSTCFCPPRSSFAGQVRRRCTTLLTCRGRRCTTQHHPHCTEMREKTNVEQSSLKNLRPEDGCPLNDGGEDVVGPKAPT